MTSANPGSGGQSASDVPTAFDHSDDAVGNDEHTPAGRGSFTYAGLRWKPDEDRVDGAWIGYRLAAELYHRSAR